MNTLTRNVWTLYKDHQEFYQSKRKCEQRKEYSMVSVLEKNNNILKIDYSLMNLLKLK